MIYELHPPLFAIADEVEPSLFLLPNDEGGGVVLGLLQASPFSMKETLVPSDRASHSGRGKLPTVVVAMGGSSMGWFSKVD